VQDDSYSDGGFHADTVFETQHETTSRLLGPNGKPLQYAPKPKIGFDLRKTKC
jgi:hypothetical protein